MKLKRVLAFALSVCLLLSLSLSVGAADTSARSSVVTNTLQTEKLDGSNLNVNLKDDVTDASKMALEQEIDEDAVVRVLIIMDSESVVEVDGGAVVNDETTAMRKKLKQEQDSVIAKIERNVLGGKSLDVRYSYTWLLNGVAASVPYGIIKDIKNVDGVKQVLLQPVYEVCTAETNTISDGVMIGRESTWANGYTGKGIKIAVIDTGLDLDHQNFQALPEDKLTKDSADADTVAAVLSGLNASKRYEGLTVSDVYRSTKVAFAYNYCDNNLDVTHDNDSQGDHGTHVAGIAAANKVDESEVVGVAPDAQLYIMKVFGYAGGAYTEDILAALEDALMLGADVVNMSLGSSAGFTSDGEEVDAIYNRVAETNTVLTVSAGNNYTAGYGNQWGTNANMTMHPDNAVIGSPGVYANVLSVASVENWMIQAKYVDADGYRMIYEAGTPDDGVEIPELTTLTGAYQVVSVPGTGAVSDYEGLDVTGKIALVQRGSLSFSEKATNAEAAGAAGCLIYNNVSGIFYMSLQSSDDVAGYAGKMPVASISLESGSYLIAAAEENPALTITFPTEEGAVPSENAYKMSEFSSWGVAPDLSLEPDITAPGGNIYSTINDGQYGLMSGTSMAAPNLAGISALVMQYAKEHFDAESTDYRTLVRDLLMSTSTPLSYDESGTAYSPRSQGSGLANAFNAVTTQSYLTVDGSDTSKAELGDDPEKTGSYSFSYHVNNISDKAAFYSLSTVAQTEGVVSDGEGNFMSSTPMLLNAATAESSASMVLTHDVDDNGKTDSHDAYLIYRAAIGKSEQADWEETSFRYDVNCDEAVSAADVTAYLDALVGLNSDADLDDTVLKVAAGETATVTVSVTLAESDTTYFDTYYTNGGYVEGFSYLTARTQGGVDLSLPYLGFYGDWNEAPVLDDGSYEDFMREEYFGNQYPNILFTNYYYQDYGAYPGINVYSSYVDEEFDINHVSISPNADGYFDTIDDMYVSLLRNATKLTFRYVDASTGEVYYEESVQNVSKSCYSSSYGQIIPYVYTWYAEEIYDFTDADGNTLANNTKVLLEVEAVGVGEGDTAEKWSVPVTVDLEAPNLLSAKKLMDLDTGETTLELTFSDNVSVSVVALLSSDGSRVYAISGTEDGEPDENGNQNYTLTFDTTGMSGKAVIMLDDYASNTAYYGVNLAGAGASYGDFVAFQYDIDSGVNSWVSFNEGVDMDETIVFDSDSAFVCAEYVNGYVYAQTKDGKLYGFTYDSMLGDTMTLEYTYITTLERTYQDLTYSYVEGKLMGLYTTEDSWNYPTSEVYSIEMSGDYNEEWLVSRGGVYGLTLACDDAGTLYILGQNYDWDTEELTETAHLWAAEREVYTYSWGGYVSYAFAEQGDTGYTMNYLQSMTWDHNTENLYWARFDVIRWNMESELIKFDLSQKEEITDDDGTVIGEMVHTDVVGTLSGETCALFVPLTKSAAEKEEHSNVATLDTSVIAKPVMRTLSATMNVGGTETLACDFDPWYSEHKTLVWSSSNENVATVDQNGKVTAIATGSAVITAANAEDLTLFDTCSIEVSALDLTIEGLITEQTEGTGSTGGVHQYTFTMENGVSSLTSGNAITASSDLNFGLSLGASAFGRGSIWATEYNNTGMLYEIDPTTGEVKDALQPIDGDQVFGLTYSASQDTFAGIMDMYLYTDLAFTHEQEEEMLKTYDPELNAFMFHRVNLLPYLIESGTGFVTGENNNGASSEVVFSGITVMEQSYYFEDTYKDYLGNWAYGGSVNYTSDQTIVLMDNVGRLWYIDEIIGMTKEADEWGNVSYTSENGSYIMSNWDGSLRNGMFEVEISDADGNLTYNVFNIRKLEETPLTEMFRRGTMPRTSYVFSDIALGGYTADGAPIFLISLYDYWNNGTTNELYLYVPEVSEFDWSAYEDVVISPEKFFALGNTGEHNIIATIHSAKVTGGLDSESETVTTEDTTEVKGLTVGVYTR